MAVNQRFGYDTSVGNGFSRCQQALKQNYQYMFGHGILVAPVTNLCISQIKVLIGISSFKGGKTTKTGMQKNIIPLFNKSGSIIPLGKFMKYTSELKADTNEIRIYKGSNGHFDLCEDVGVTGITMKKVNTALFRLIGTKANKRSLSERMGGIKTDKL